ncbi:MAG: glycosyl transferase family 1 [Candidatus Tectimicrobiota bacterium]|nr:MAG: glycosyl transferase family 1 [Candidatus Tectomicrobia bacterium]
MDDPLRLDDYAPFVGEATVEEIRLLARQVAGARIQHLNSTRVGGGVAELLGRLVPLMNDVGLEAEWTVIEAPEAFFAVTKRFHNALHGAPVALEPEMLSLYRQVMAENAAKLRPDADFIVIHDPQPLGLVEWRHQTAARWIWRCHIDIAAADLRVWGFLKPLIDRFDAMIVHIPQFLRRDVFVPQYIVPPFIDPLSAKNRELPAATVQQVLKDYQIPDDQPFILQVSRFDRLKDPLGALRAYEMVKRSIDVGFVMAGNFATDDPEGREVFEEVSQKARLLADTKLIVNADDTAINALQRAAAVVIQKSLREGFGLAVTEAMWKGKPVVGGDTGGIAYQILDGVTGFLVKTVEGAAYRLRQLLSNPLLAERIGQEAHLWVQSTFLVPHYLRNWLCVLLACRHPESGLTALAT